MALLPAREKVELQNNSCIIKTSETLPEFCQPPQSTPSCMQCKRQPLAGWSFSVGWISWFTRPTPDQLSNMVKIGGLLEFNKNRPPDYFLRVCNHSGETACWLCKECWLGHIEKVKAL